MYRAVLLGFGCVLFVYLLVRLGAAGIVSLLLRVGWRFGLIAALYAGHQMVRTLAWRKCSIASQPLSYWDMVKIRLSGEAVQFLTFTGPFLAEPAKMWLLKRRGLGPKQAVAATVCEYLLYNITSAAFAVGGLMYLRNNFELSRPVTVAAKVTVYALSAFLFTAAYAIVSRTYLIGALIEYARRLPLAGRYVRLDRRDVRDTEDFLFAVLRDRPLRLLMTLGIEFTAQALLVLELMVYLWSARIPFSASQSLVIEAGAKFISLAFFFIPGQTGAAEGVYALIFEAVGLSASGGFTLAVVRRLRSLLIAGTGLAFASTTKEFAADTGPGSS